MISVAIVPPPWVPAFGAIITLGSDDWQFITGPSRPAGRPLKLQVKRSWLDLSRFYGGAWLRVDGWEAIRPCQSPPGPYVRAIIRVDAIRPEARDPHYQPEPVPREHQRILALRVAGWSASAIAQECHTSVETAEQVVDAEISRLYHLGVSQTAIRQYLRVSPKRVTSVREATGAACCDGWAEHAEPLRLLLRRHQDVILDRLDLVAALGTPTEART